VELARRPAEAASLLLEMTKDKRHVYFGVAPAPVEELFRGRFARLLGFKQVTDTYLLALAESRLLALAGTDQSVELIGR